MVRSRAYLALGLGVSLLVASSCSSSDDKKKARPDDAAGAGQGGASTGEDAGGAGKTAVGGEPAGGVKGVGEGGASAGAGGEGELTDGWLSGTRLRAVVQVVGNARLFETWHDSELDVDCTFMVDAHGTERCLPTQERGYAAYTDTKCTKAVALFDAAQDLPAYVQEPYQPFECGHGAMYYEVGAAVAAPTTVYSMSSGDCLPNGNPTDTEVARALGAVVPPETFVAASKTVREARDARLSANVRVAEDGSRQVVSHFDREREADCNPRFHAGDDSYACVPEDRAYIEYFFADDACEVPAAYHPAYAQQVCGREPTIIQNSSPNFSDGYFEVGEQVTGDIFWADGADCKEYVSSGDPGATYFLAGKEIPWSALAPLGSTNRGTGRVVVHVLLGQDDELISREELFDTKLGVTCSSGVATDQQTRCLPRASYGVNEFADDKCSQALWETPAGMDPPSEAAFLQANAAEGGVAVFQLGAKVAKPAEVWQWNGLDCQMRGVSDGVDYYDTTVLAPAQMPLVTFETE